MQSPHRKALSPTWESNPGPSAVAFIQSDLNRGKTIQAIETIVKH